MHSWMSVWTFITAVARILILGRLAAALLLLAKVERKTMTPTLA